MDRAPNAAAAQRQSLSAADLLFATTSRRLSTRLQQREQPPIATAGSSSLLARRQPKVYASPVQNPLATPIQHGALSPPTAGPLMPSGSSFALSAHGPHGGHSASSFLGASARPLPKRTASRLLASHRRRSTTASFAADTAPELHRRRSSATQRQRSRRRRRAMDSDDEVSSDSDSDVPPQATSSVRRASHMEEMRSLRTQSDLDMSVALHKRRSSAQLRAALSRNRPGAGDSPRSPRRGDDTKSAGSTRTASTIGPKTPAHRARKALRRALRKTLEYLCKPRRVESLKHDAYFVLPPFWLPRVVVYNITKHWVFETVIILLILTNCVFLALNDPLASEPPSYERPVDIFFTSAFAVEMGLKLFCLGGVVHRGAYLRSPWNVLDCLIVITGVLNLAVNVGSFTAFRTLRVLRPLRSMNAVKGLQVLVIGLFASLRGLAHVSVLAFSSIFVFAVLAVNLFGGALRQRCVEIATGNITESYCRVGATDENGYWGYGCPDGFTCVRTESNPRWGLYHYDNVLNACLTCFTVVTFEDWTVILEATIATVGYISFFYYFALLILCSYFIPNLALAVINDEFVKAQQDADDAEREEQEKEQLDHYHRALMHAEDDALAHRPSLLLSLEDTSESEEELLSSGSPPAAPEGAWNPLAIEADGAAHLRRMTRRGERAPQGIAERIQSCGRRVRRWWHRARDLVHNFSEGFERRDSPFRRTAESVMTDDGLALLGGMPKSLAQEDDEELAHLTWFSKFIIGCILLNTVVLASHHYGEPDWLSQIQRYSNWVFTGIFAVEFVIRLFALGPWRYVQDAFNVLDAVVVAASVVEIGLSGSSVAPAFRALRLLRILKLLRSFPSLREIVHVTMHAVRGSMYLLAIIALYLFIIAIIGAELLGGKMQDVQRQTGSRMNYDSFLLSFYTSFQILTFDGWAATMYEAIEATNLSAALYFCGQILIGNYVLLSLFLSILLSSFDKLEAETDAEVDNEHLLVFKLFDMEVARHVFGRDAAVALHGEDFDGAAENEGKGASPEESPPPSPAAAAARRLSRPMEDDEELRRHALKEKERAAQEEVPVAEVIKLSAAAERVYNRAMVFYEDEALEEGEWSPSGSPPGGGASPDANNGSHKNEDGKHDASGATAATLAPPAAPSASLSPRTDDTALSPPFRTPPSDVLRHYDGNDSQRPPSDEFASAVSQSLQSINFGPPAASAVAGSSPHDRPHELPRSGTQHRAAKKSQRALSTPRTAALAAPDPFGALELSTDGVRSDPATPAPGSLHVGFGASSDRELEELRDRHSPGILATQPSSMGLPPVLSGIVLKAAPEPVPEEAAAEVCPACGQEMVPPLPAAPLVVPTDPRDLHAVQCRVIAARLAKVRLLEALLRIVGFHMRVGTRPTAKNVDLVVGEAHTAGLLLSEHAERFIDQPEGWAVLEAELQEEAEILDLRVGEEQVGRSLIAFALSNVPVEHATNGGRALFFFGPKNPFRVLCSQTVQHPYFDRGILLCIFLSTIAMALDNPLHDRDSPLQIVLERAGWFFTAVFGIEMGIKCVAFGFAFHEGAYVRDPWNVLDGFIVVVSVLSYALTVGSFSALRVFRTLRALRPLRVINRNRGLKMVVRTLLESVRGIMHVVLICGINYLIFSILAVQFFGGKFQSCTDPSVPVRANCTGAYHNAALNRTLPREWESEERNFDNVYNAMTALFEISTGEWWGPLLYRSMDACSEDRGPERECNQVAGLFFIVFFAVSGFFLINLFVGVVIHNFKVVKEQMDGSSFMTQEQKTWVSAQQLLLNFRPAVAQLPDLQSPLSVRLFPFVGSDRFEFFIAVCILLNVLVMAVDFYDMPTTLEAVTRWANHGFALVFLVEAAFKIACFRLRYFRLGWNQFDFFLVVVSIVGFALEMAGTDVGVDVAMLRVFRIFRVLRILRLVKRLKRIRVLVETLWYSLPSMANIGAFVMLIDFIYAVLGLDLFAKLDIPDDAHLFNYKQTNFRRLDHALVMLFRYQTVEDWNSGMHDCSVSAPRCDDNCGNRYLATAYYVSFLVITSFVVTNLLIAIILDNFETTMQMDQSGLKMTHVHRFVDIWAEFDDDATMTIPSDAFARLLAKLQPPLGLSRVSSRFELLRLTGEYRIPEHGGYIHFIETLIPLARKVKERDESGDRLVLSDREVREHEAMWRLTFPHLADLPVLRYRERAATIDMFYAATFIGSAFRTRCAIRTAHVARLQRLVTLMEHCERKGIPLHTVASMRRAMQQYQKPPKQRRSLLGELSSVGTPAASGILPAFSFGGPRIMTATSDSPGSPTPNPTTPNPATPQRAPSASSTAAVSPAPMSDAPTPAPVVCVEPPTPQPYDPTSGAASPARGMTPSGSGGDGTPSKAEPGAPPAAKSDLARPLFSNATPDARGLPPAGILRRQGSESMGQALAPAVEFALDVPPPDRVPLALVDPASWPPAEVRRWKRRLLRAAARPGGFIAAPDGSLSDDSDFDFDATTPSLPTPTPGAKSSVASVPEPKDGLSPQPGPTAGHDRDSLLPAPAVDGALSDDTVAVNAPPEEDSQPAMVSEAVVDSPKAKAEGRRRSLFNVGLRVPSATEPALPQPDVEEPEPKGRGYRSVILQRHLDRRNKARQAIPLHIASHRKRLSQHQGKSPPATPPVAQPSGRSVVDVG